MTDYTSNPVRDAANNDRDKENYQARLDSQVKDYIQFLLTNQDIDRWGNTPFNDMLIDWFAILDVRDIGDLIRLNLLAGEPEKAGQALIASLQEYLREAASVAVRERNKV